MAKLAGSNRHISIAYSLRNRSNVSTISPKTLTIPSGKGVAKKRICVMLSQHKGFHEMNEHGYNGEQIVCVLAMAL